MSASDELLGTAPPGSLDAVVSGLTRLRRHYDADSETEQSRSFTSNQLDSARVQLIDSLRAWVQAGVEREAALDVPVRRATRQELAAMSKAELTAYVDARAALAADPAYRLDIEAKAFARGELQEG